MKECRVWSLSSYFKGEELMISPRNLIYSFFILFGSIEINLSFIIQSLNDSFFEHIDKNIGFINEAFESSKPANRSKAFLILSIISGYSEINSKA